MMSEENPIKVLREDKFSDLYKLYSSIPKSKFNFLFPIIISLILLVSLLIVVYYYVPIRNLSTDIGHIMQELSSDIIIICSSILALWLTAFTIFTTFANTELFVFMNQKVRSDARGPNISELKYTIVIFIGVVTHFLTLLITSLFIKYTVSQNGIITDILTRVCYQPLRWYGFVVLVVFCAYVGYITYVMALIKSLVYNIYAFVAVGIEYEGARRRRNNMWPFSDKFK
ncbi:hypothetical protein SAMN05216241_10615 [Limimonas halophila]|uniref:Uncharacterized protein n=1 Tax=Limimonas halophila TaxID=1082479 RepID=A0A1G7RVQ2_9PROT|nr:hypothetical protein SAMN05216241_10615 [Limimonas halophila]